MLTAEAVIQIEQPERYLARLGEHTGKMGHRAGHWPRRHSGEGTPPATVRSDWSATQGTVAMDWGEWTAQAGQGTLTLRVQAADADNLRRIKEMLTKRLETFGRRERLTVSWQEPRSPGDAPE